MLIITGTGRSGNTVIALWLRELGLLPYDGEIIPKFSAGLEPKDVRRVNSAIWLGNDAPLQSIPAQENAIKEFKYSVVKDSMFFYGNVLNTWLSVRNDLKFLVTIRNFTHVHKSLVQNKQLNRVRTPEEIQSECGKFFSQIILNKLPYETICFPDFVEDYDDVHEKIMTLEPSLNIDYKKGKEVWEEVIQKNLLNR
jgi:hypothetical protein